MSRVLRNTSFAACAFLAMAGVANAQTYTARLTSAQEVPTNASTATGYARIFINEAGLSLSYTVVFTGLTSNQTTSSISNAPIGANGGVLIGFGPGLQTTSGTISGTAPINALEIAEIRAGRGYINVHSTVNPAGEIRGQLALRRTLDFDGDGQSDYSVLRFPGTGSPKPITQYNLNSTTGFQYSYWGDADTDFPCPGDYDGDAKDDICMYRGGASPGAQSVFYIQRSSDQAVRIIPWGVQGDQAVARDYDGDGITDIAIFRPGASAAAQTVWWILQSRTATVRIVAFGTTGTSAARDFAAPEDYDGDGSIDVAVYRFGLSPANTFIVLGSTAGLSFFEWGNFNTDYVVPRDYDGDGKADYAVGRTGASGTSQLVWWIRRSSDGQVNVTPFGFSQDALAPGDFDGDGRVDITVARSQSAPPMEKVFYTIGSFANNFIIKQWGVSADFVVGSFNVF